MHLPLTMSDDSDICPANNHLCGPVSFSPIGSSTRSAYQPFLFQKLCNQFFIRLVCLVRTITASQRPSTVHAPFYAPLGCAMDTSSRLGRLGRGAEHVIGSAPEFWTAALRGTGTGKILGPHMQRSIPRLANLPLLELAAEECRLLGS